MLTTNVLPVLGDRPLYSITVDDVRAVVAGSKRAPNTIRAFYSILASLFACAVDDRVIGESPCQTRRIKLPAAGEREVAVLRPVQIHALGSAMATTNPRYAALVWLAAMTGLRIGELLGLTWEQIDLARGTLTVDRQMQHRMFTTVKTKASRRTVPLTAHAVAVLRAHKHRHGANATTVPWDPETGRTPDRAHLVFTRTDGSPLNYNNTVPPLATACDAANVPGTTWHTLRHSYASALIADGTHPRAIQARMGHTSIAVTMDVYGHLFPEEDDRTRDTITRTFAAYFPDDGDALGGLPANA